ncbi:MAG: hypothetical protein WDM77_03890 [Steroidobacteraceae bacterium]
MGYVEFAYAKQNKMANVLLINQAHKAIAPSAASFPGGRIQWRLGPMPRATIWS